MDEKQFKILTAKLDEIVHAIQTMDKSIAENLDSMQKNLYLLERKTVDSSNVTYDH